MVGISIAPKRLEAMTQIATLITHAPDLDIPILEFNPAPFAAAIKMVRKVAPGAEIKPGRIYRVRAHFHADVRMTLQGGYAQKGRVSGDVYRQLDSDEEIGPIQKWWSHSDHANVILELPNGGGYVNTHRPEETKRLGIVTRNEKEVLLWINKKRDDFDGDWINLDWMKLTDNQMARSEQDAAIEKREEDERVFKQRLTCIESQMNQDVAVFL